MTEMSAHGMWDDLFEGIVACVCSPYFSTLPDQILTTVAMLATMRSRWHYHDANGSKCEAGVQAGGRGGDKDHLL